MGLDIDPKEGIWYHNVSECYYHIQITVKYRKALLAPEVEKMIKMTITGFKERFAIDIHEIGFDQNHILYWTPFLVHQS